MSRIKHTKNELKNQQEALRRFERFLPMLQLKKQQLQAELLSVDHNLHRQETEEQTLRSAIEPWIGLFSEPAEFEKLLRIEEIRTSEANIAGVNVPVLEEVIFERACPDLYATPPWIDAGLDAIEQLVRHRVSHKILEEQRKLIGEELRVTAQRVNLFEKVKIPETRDNIRTIRIFLGDQQTAAVARAKIAKARTVKYESEAA